jgi:hypothetical protein
LLLLCGCDAEEVLWEFANVHLWVRNEDRMGIRDQSQSAEPRSPAALPCMPEQGSTRAQPSHIHASPPFLHQVPDCAQPQLLHLQTRARIHWF